MTEQQDTFISHLIELRARLIKAVLAVLLVLVVLLIYPGPQTLTQWLVIPLLDNLREGGHLLSVGVLNPVIVPLKVTLIAACLISLPVILYQAWAFVAPGLYTKEKHFALPLVISSTMLFFAGMAFCYFVVFQSVFKFIAQFSPEAITFSPDIGEYLDFVITMFIAFGITFEIPVVVVLLVRLGIVKLAALRKARAYVIVGAFVVAAVVTPPDPISQFLLAIPICLLFEVGLFIGRFVEPKVDPADEDSLVES